MAFFPLVSGSSQETPVSSSAFCPPRLSKGRWSEGAHNAVLAQMDFRLKGNNSTFVRLPPSPFSLLHAPRSNCAHRVINLTTVLVIMRDLWVPEPRHKGNKTWMKLECAPNIFQLRAFRLMRPWRWPFSWVEDRPGPRLVQQNTFLLLFLGSSSPPPAPAPCHLMWR